jgi:type IV secretion system protein VirB8
MKTEDQALPVQRAALAEHYREVESFQRARARRAQRTSQVLLVVAGVAILGNLAQALTIAFLTPLTRLVPVYLWVRNDGTVDSSIALSRLPATQARAVIDAALWEYVRLREGYSADTALYDYTVVSERSAGGVRADYQRVFNYPNPLSPQVTIGRKGTIVVEHVTSADLAPGIQQIRYRRTVTIAGQAAHVTTWTATVGWQTVSTLPVAMRLRNPGGVIVTSYQSAEDSVE